MRMRGRLVNTLAGTVLFLTVSSACTLFPSNPAPAVGDTCLAGNWVEVEEDNVSGYTWLGLPLPVSGLAGARLAIRSDGGETLTFDGSRPLVGITRAGQQLAIFVRGSVRFKVHGDGKKYTETGAVAQMPTTATLNGQPVTYHSSQTPGPGTYSCAGTTLTMTTHGGVQTDHWTRQ